MNAVYLFRGINGCVSGVEQAWVRAGGELGEQAREADHLAHLGDDFIIC
jgi:hypothetical protein